MVDLVNYVEEYFFFKYSNIFNINVKFSPHKRAKNVVVQVIHLKVIMLL